MTTGYGQQVAPSGPPPPPPSKREGWTAGRTVVVVLGSLLALVSLGLLAAGGTALWGDQTQRENGYLSTNSAVFTTSGYALASNNINLYGVGRSLLGDVRIRLSSTDGAPIFAGIAPANQVNSYLGSVQYATLDDFTNNHSAVTNHSGAAPATVPATSTIWSTKTSGPGTQTLTWKVQDGNWTIVAMNADGSRGVSLRADVGVTVPWLIWAATGLLIAGAVLLIGGIVLIVVSIRRASYRSPAGAPTYPAT